MNRSRRLRSFWYPRWGTRVLQTKSCGGRDQQHPCSGRALDLGSFKLRVKLIMTIQLLTVLTLGLDWLICPVVTHRQSVST